MTYTDFIEKTLLETSKIALANFGKVKGRIKKEDKSQVLTDTDIEIGNYVISEIKKNFPDHNIIDEEAGVVDNGSQFTWVVDPIDGTSNFAVGVVTYGIMIGLLQKNTPISGGLSLPSLKEIIIAQKEKGAFLNGKKTKVNEETDLNKVLISIGTDPNKKDPELFREKMRIVAKILLSCKNLRTSNSVFDEAMAAKGSYGGAVLFSSKIWDNVASQIIIEEAGGIYTDLLGKPVDYSNPFERTRQNFTSCAAAPVIHKKLQKIIHNTD